MQGLPRQLTCTLPRSPATHLRSPELTCAHLQCTAMGWSPVCCCCFCTAAMRSIMPLPSAGIPTSGQPWKWNWRTTRVCSSWRAGGCRREAGLRGPVSWPRLRNSPGPYPRGSHVARLRVTLQSVTLKLRLRCSLLSGEHISRGHPLAPH